MPQPRVVAHGRLRSRDRHRVHGQSPPVAARLRAAVRDRDRRPRRGPDGAPHHERRRLRPGRRSHRPRGGRPLRALRRRVASAVRTDRCHQRVGTGGRAGAPGPASARLRRSLRASVGVVGRRPFGDRPAAHGGPALADRRRVPRGGLRCRAHPRRHRRAVDLSRHGGDGHERGRCHRGRRSAATPADVDQRRRRPSRTGRRGHRGDARGGEWSVPPRVVLPHGLGVDVRDTPARLRR